MAGADTSCDIKTPPMPKHRGVFGAHTDLTDLTDLFFRCKQRVFSFGLNGKTPKESKSVSISEQQWVGKMKCCIFALWFRKRSRTRISQISRIFFRCKQRGFSFGLSMEELRRSKNPWDPWDPCGKTKPPRGENFVRFERFVFKNQALRSAHSTLTINHLNT